MQHDLWSFTHFTWTIAYIRWLCTVIIASIIFHFNPLPVFIEVIKLKFCVPKDKVVNMSYITFCSKNINKWLEM